MTRILSTPIGALALTAHAGMLTAIRFGTSVTVSSPDDSSAADSPVLTQAQRQLDEYFTGVRKTFDLPLAPAGTAFQRAVWDALLTIPYGEVRTYADIARALGNPGASRAVGMACHVNPLPIVIPCHRVVGKAGLTGYAGGLHIKEALLHLEGVL